MYLHQIAPVFNNQHFVLMWTTCLHSNNKSLSKLETTIEGGFNFSQQCSKMHNKYIYTSARRQTGQISWQMKGTSQRKLVVCFPVQKRWPITYSDCWVIPLGLSLRSLMWISKCYQLNIDRTLLLHLHWWQTFIAAYQNIYVDLFSVYSLGNRVEELCHEMSHLLEKRECCVHWPLHSFFHRRICSSQRALENLQYCLSLNRVILFLLRATIENRVSWSRDPICYAKCEKCSVKPSGLL